MLKVLLAMGFLGVSALAHSGVFESPTGNIQCSITDDGGVECYIHQITKSTVKKPKDCPLDWGHTFYVGRTGKGMVVCHGDVPEALTGYHYTTLGYGKSVSSHNWKCTSQKSGMTCKNKQGHGFTVSKAKQSVF